jgi:hypothetical protein
MPSATPPPPSAESQHALPVGLRIDEFEIRSVLGIGGFGIVYHAFDHALERDVAIKEYMPSSLAARSRTLHVSLLSQGHAETFALGLKSFVNEARLLARFDHPSLVKVHRFWEANGTAYMVMPLYRGRTLKALRASLSESPSEAWLRRLLEPLLGTLEVLHAEGVFHRDIAPDNILVGDDGRPVLLDFGAARRVISDQSQTLTAILKPSYAPIEQYAEATGLRQGAWTDLYALGATLCFAVTGRAPQPATARALGTDCHLLAAEPRRGISDEFLRIVDWMMAPRPEHRPQSVAALREALDGHAAAPLPPAPVTSPAAPAAWERTVVQTTQAPAVTAAAVADAPVEPIPAPASPALAAPRAKAPRWPLAAAALVIAGVAVAAWRLSPPRAAEAAPALAATVIAPAPVVAAPPAASNPEPTAAITAASAPAPAAIEPAAMPVKVVVPKPQRPTSPATPLDTPQRSAAVSLPAPQTAPAVAEPAPKPTPTAAAAPLRPREQCEGRHLLALHRCLKRVCQDPALVNHLDCKRMRQLEANSARPSEY